jgi:hypothetical protein
VAAAVGCLCLSPVAQAKLPHPKSTAIKPGKSIGGIKLDMSPAKVFHLWGHTHCPAPGSYCEWVGSGKAGHQERATVSFVKGKVSQIVINAATSGNNGRFKPGKLSKWKTSKKISLGSKKSAVKRAYKSAKSNPSIGVMGFDLFAGKRPNLRYTRFSTPGFGASSTRLRSIQLAWDVCHYMKC